MNGAFAALALLLAACAAPDAPPAARPVVRAATVAARPDAGPGPAPAGGVLAEASAAQREAAEFEVSLAADRAEIIQVLLLTQDLRDAVDELRLHPAPANAAAVSAAARSLRAAARPQPLAPASGDVARTLP